MPTVLDPHVICHTPEQARQMGKNALAKGHRTLAKACFHRHGILVADALGLEGIDRHFEIANAVYEGMTLYAKHGRNQRANYTRQHSKGRVVEYLENRMHGPVSTETARTQRLMRDDGILEWVDEQTVVLFAELFTPAAVATAMARLAEMD